MSEAVCGYYAYVFKIYWFKRYVLHCYSVLLS